MHSSCTCIQATQETAFSTDDDDNDTTDDFDLMDHIISPDPASPPPRNRRKQGFKPIPFSNISELLPVNKSSAPPKLQILKKLSRTTRARSKMPLLSPMNIDVANSEMTDFTITDGCRIVVDHSNQRESRQSVTGVVCSKCGFIGRTTTDLIDHQRVHTKAKPFKCPVCPSVFSRTQNMRHHIRYDLLNGSTFSLGGNSNYFVISRFNCEESKRQGLADKFQQRAVVQKAKLVPTKVSDLKFKCLKCVEKFTTRTKLQHHLRVHSVGMDGNVFKCSFCKGLFYSLRSATDHEARMHNKFLKKGHQCPHCEKNLATNSSLKRHLYLSHLTEYGENGIDSDASSSKQLTPATPNTSTSSKGKTKKKQQKRISNKSIDNQVDDGEGHEWPQIVEVKHVPAKQGVKSTESWTWPTVTAQESLADDNCDFGDSGDVNSMVKVDIKHSTMEFEPEESEIIEMNGSGFFLEKDPLAF